MTKINTLFLDIGGVLGTNGWDHHLREEAAKQFGLDWEDFQTRHKEFYDLHETGQITLEEYLKKVIFWKERKFTLQQFKEFMFTHSKPYPEMIDFMRNLKKRFNLRITVVSNEGRDLAEYRIKAFDLHSFVDDFFISCFVHYQKPNPNIYQIALDVTQKTLDQIIYIDDRQNLIEAAEKLGFLSIHHISYTSTQQELEIILTQQCRHCRGS